MENIRTPIHRGSFCNWIDPQEQKNEETGEVTKKWGYSMLLVKGDEQTEAFLAKLKAQFDEAMIAKFGKKLIQDKLPHYPIIDGDEPDAEGETRKEHEGHWVVRVTSFKRPNLVNKKGEPITNKDDAYSGAWYVSSVRARAWDNPKSGKGVSVTVLGGIKMRDDDQFGEGSINAQEEFADLIEADDAPAPKAAAPASAKPGAAPKPAPKAAPPKPKVDPLAGL